MFLNDDRRIPPFPPRYFWVVFYTRICGITLGVLGQPVFMTVVYELYSEINYGSDSLVSKGVLCFGTVV